MKFTYTDITTKGCEGWINLFFGEMPVACVPCPGLAAEIKKEIEEFPGYTDDSEEET